MVHFHALSSCVTSVPNKRSLYFILAHSPAYTVFRQMWLNPLPCEQQPVVSALEKLQGNLMNSEHLKSVAFNKNYWTWDRVSKGEFTKSNTFFFNNRTMQQINRRSPLCYFKTTCKVGKRCKYLKSGSDECKLRGRCVSPQPKPQH